MSLTRILDWNLINLINVLYLIHFYTLMTYLMPYVLYLIHFYTL